MSMNCGRTGVWVPGMRPALRDISPSVTAIGDVSRESPSRGRSHLRVGFRLLTVIERIGAVGPRAATTGLPADIAVSADTHKGRRTPPKSSVIWHSQEMRRPRVAERILLLMTPP